MNIRIKLLGLAILAMFIQPAFGESALLSCFDGEFCSANSIPTDVSILGCKESNCYTYQKNSCFSGSIVTKKYDVTPFFSCTSCNEGRVLSSREIVVHPIINGKINYSVDITVEIKICSNGCSAGQYGNCCPREVCMNSSFCCSSCPDGGKSMVGDNRTIDKCFKEASSDSTGTYVYSGTGANYDGTTCSYTN